MNKVLGFLMSEFYAWDTIPTFRVKYINIKPASYISYVFQQMLFGYVTFNRLIDPY